MDNPSVRKCKILKNHGQTLSGRQIRVDRRTCEYRTENNKSDYGLESSSEKILLGLRWVMRRFEAALRESGNEHGTYPDLKE